MNSQLLQTGTGGQHAVYIIRDTEEEDQECTNLKRQIPHYQKQLFLFKDKMSKLLGTFIYFAKERPPGKTMRTKKKWTKGA